MNIVAFIFARGGSKGIPNKNIRPLLDKPLISWSIEQAKSIKEIDRVVVSTDSLEIRNVALQYGAEVPFLRPSHLAQDDSPEIAAWKHALQYWRDNEGNLPDIMLSIPPTAPLRSKLDIENCIKMFQEGDSDLVVTVSDSHRNPYFNMVNRDQKGFVDLLLGLEKSIARRQDAPPVFDLATVAYVANPEYVMTCEYLLQGKIRSVIVPKERAIDIDSLLDFHFAEYLLRERTALY